ncbi:TIGR03086 family metal-binding protein [Streptomyces boncukensis]|uniref:TIGR03086 family protein n=1 Tax=Streptomyces boncukensis TaxID=2711219 RepID=A0A6G4WRS5_9ACTN|nr:TIGR03086 family protein [Streptomyces boncukensis]
MNETPAVTDPRPRFDQAADRLAALVGSVRPEHLERPTPCAEFAVRELLGHVTGVMRRVAHVGRGGASHDMSTQVTGVTDSGWAAAFADAAQQARAAWADGARLADTVAAPWGEAPGRTALEVWTMETVAHTWDLARALGRPSGPDEGPAAAALETARRMLPGDMRGEGVPFGPVHEVPGDADAYARLAAWLGRDPEWAPPGGMLLTPGDEGYDAECEGFQAGDRHRPDEVVLARSAEDVRQAVADARRRGLPVAVQATGHGLARSARGGVLVSTRRMTGIRVDPEARTAWVEAGVRAGDLVAQAGRYGLAPVNGSFPGVGVVSYVLGGGVGVLGRRYGYATDHVRRIEVVTGDGRLRQVTAGSDPELFRGLRGGGGGLGVVTGMELDLVPVERIYGGRLVHDGGAGAAEEILAAWREWTRTVPEEMSSALSLLPLPDVPDVPEPLRGRYLAQVHIAFTGSREDGEKLVATLRATLGEPLVDELREMPYTESASVFSEPDAPHAYRSDNVLLDEGGLGPDEVSGVLREAGPDAGVMCVLGVRHLGGAFARGSGAPDAVGHRDAAYLLSVLSPLDGTDSGTVRALHGRALDAVRGHTLGRRLNFLYGPQDEATVRACYEPADLERLHALKEAYDPVDLFRFTQGLPEAG